MNVRGLSVSEFGYRSAHVLGAISAKDALGDLAQLAGITFEIQVRTVLGHAWAEIEHDEVYKSGVLFEARTKRDLAAIAGMLEYLDGQFALLRTEKVKLVDAYVARYRAGEDGAEPLDVARLTAFFEVLRPDAKGWRLIEGSDRLPPRSDASVVSALRATGVASANALKAVISSAKFRRKERALAASEGVATDGLSHLAIAILAVGVTDLDALVDYPELTRFSDIAKVFKLVIS